MDDWMIYTFPVDYNLETPEVLDEGPLPRGKKGIPLH